MTAPTDKGCDVFVRYSSRDTERVGAIVGRLDLEGVTVWRDKHKILGGGGYGPEIVSAIRQCRLLMVMCSGASMRSRNVKQEIQLAWAYEPP